MNNTDRLSDPALLSLATQVNSITKTGGAAYGLSVDQSSNMDTSKTTFGTSLTDVAAKKAALKASVQGKEADRSTLLDAISSIAATVYNNPAVTDEMIAALGLQPRATTRQKITPKLPGTLIALPSTNGTVTLKWGRGENKYGVVYVVEMRDEAGTWMQIFSTTKTHITLTGFVPGVQAWFRVKATKNNLTSIPSNEAPIYHNGGADAFLTVAA